MRDDAAVRELADQVWERVLDRDPVAALRCRGGQVDALPRGGPAAMEHDVSVAAGALARLTGFDGVEAAFLRDHLAQEVAEAQRFWYRFPVTPYNAYPLHAYRSEIFAVAGFRDGSDVDRYLKLLGDYAALVEQLGETMAGQRKRGEVERITARIRGELGVTDESGYRRRLTAEPGMYASSPAELERLFQGHIDRLLPHLPRYFDRLPAAPFLLRPLDASLSGLTYGFYEPPGTGSAGYYHYNAASLPSRPLLQAASVIYHEGMPGHHMQMGRLAENTALHPIRRQMTELRTFALNGYLEGWAEYAAALCDEIGLYADPADRYGRLSSERFHAARLVVDTGLNVLGWPRERAAAYLRASGFLADIEIGTELLRYAVDDPGQALAYHLGHWYLRELRGTRDPRQFHEEVLAEGPLPLAILGRQLNGEPSRPAGG